MKRLREAIDKDLLIALAVAEAAIVGGAVAFGAIGVYVAVGLFFAYVVGNLVGHRQGLEKGSEIAKSVYADEINVGRQVLVQLRIQETAREAARRN